MMDEEVIYIDDSDCDPESEPDEVLYIEHGEDLIQNNGYGNEPVDKKISIPEMRKISSLHNGSTFEEERIRRGPVNVLLNRILCYRDVNKTNAGYNSQRVESYDNLPGYAHDFRDCYMSTFNNGYYGNPNNPYVSQNPNDGYNFSDQDTSGYCRECDYGSVPIYPPTQTGSSSFDCLSIAPSHHHGQYTEGTEQSDSSDSLQRGNWGGDFEAEYRFWENYFGKVHEAKRASKRKVEETAREPKEVEKHRTASPIEESEDQSDENRTRIRVRIFRCDSCKFCTVKKDELTKHIEGRHLPPKYSQCTLCHQRMLQKNLVRHIQKSHLERDYKCTICLKKYVRLHAAWKHCHEHLADWSPNVLRCAFCSEDFTLRKEFNDHLVLKHLLEGTTQCLRCSYKADDFQKLKYHLKVYHAIS